MKSSTVATSAVVLLVGAAVVLSQIPPRPGLGQNPRSLGNFERARLIGQLRLILPAQISSYTDANGKSFGAGPNKVFELNEQGAPAKSFETQIARPSISPHGANGILIGDLGGRKLFTMNVDGIIKPLLDLQKVSGGPDDMLPFSQAMKSGEFSAVASDGKNVFVAFSAGFSSSIYKIDVMSQKVIGQGWASAPDPSAMNFNDGTLFVLVGRGSQIRRFSDGLQKSLDNIDLPFSSARGLGIRAPGEFRTLTKAGTEVTKVAVSPASVSRTSLIATLDRVRVVDRAIIRIKFPPLNFQQRYAVLICGDLAENFWGECFWNDTVWMYKTLIANGYTKDNIFVLYGNGVDYFSANPYYRNPTTVTDFAATSTKVNLVFDGLKNGDAANGIPKMDTNDTLFVWTFDHGGQSGGQSTLCLRDGCMLASNFNAKLNAIPYAQRAIFMQQCFSGGFIPGLQNSKTYISTACRATEVARAADTELEVVGGKTYSHGEYNFYITTALNRLLISPMAAVNADANADTFVASNELHAWEAGHENQPEIPQSSDMGGIGSIFKFKK